MGTFYSALGIGCTINMQRKGKQQVSPRADCWTKGEKGGLLKVTPGEVFPGSKQGYSRGHIKKKHRRVTG
jgi:hypothetical protein